MDVIYRAYDGKEFDSEEKCELYETISTIHKEHPKEYLGFKLFNRDGELMPLLNEDNTICEDFCYIKTHSAEEAATLHEILNTVGLSSPWDKQGGQQTYEYSAGCYYYDFNDYNWKDFKEFEHTYKTMRNMFKDDE